MQNANAGWHVFFVSTGTKTTSFFSNALTMGHLLTKTTIVAVSFSFLGLLAGCNGNSSSSSSSDSTKMGAMADAAKEKLKTAEGSVEEAANKTTSSVEESMARNPDSTFVEEVMTANNEEISLLQAGMDKATSKDLKSTAKMMIADHKGLKEKLEKFAAKNNYPVTGDQGNAQKEIDDMASKSGNDWDKAWAEKMFNAHEKAIGKFEGAKNNVKIAELKSLIETTLPTLRSHLEMVRNLQAKLNK